MKLGSPPRMRGKRCYISVSIVCNRITPAYAGKTDGKALFYYDEEDHPRVCGENKHYTISLYRPLGSPPRMRGKRTVQAENSLKGRITPAYAGKTFFTAFRNSSSWDHPRVCGENFAPNYPAQFRLGSPPRMRGKHPPQVHPFR